MRAMWGLCLVLCLVGGGLSMSSAGLGAQERRDYRVLATEKTSTMQKELNEAGAAGYRFKTVMGGEMGSRASAAATEWTRYR